MPYVSFHTSLPDHGADSRPFRIAGVIALLERMASDGSFDEGDRKHVDQEKTTLFWRIIGGKSLLIPRPPAVMGGQHHSSALSQSKLPVCSTTATFEHTRKPGTRATNSLLQTLMCAISSRIFTNIKDMVEYPLYIEELRLKLIHSSNEVTTLQQRVHSIFIKLGLLERARWKKMLRLITCYRSLEEMDGQRYEPVESWASRQLEHPHPMTRSCIKALCENLAMQTVGGVDATTRAHIRAVSEETFIILEASQYEC